MSTNATSPWANSHDIFQPRQQPPPAGLRAGALHRLTRYETGRSNVTLLVNMSGISRRKISRARIMSTADFKAEVGWDVAYAAANRSICTSEGT